MPLWNFAKFESLIKKKRHMKLISSIISFFYKEISNTREQESCADAVFTTYYSISLTSRCSEHN